MNGFRVLGAAILAVIAMVLAATATYAQTSKGTITGVVTDPTGATVPDAAVILKEQDTNATREAKTNSAGLYRFDAVELGRYSLSVTAPGFKEARVDNLVIQANRLASLDFRLELGAGSIIVQVEAAVTEILQTSEPLRGANFTPRSIAQLPLLNQSSLNLTLLAPGVQRTNTIPGGAGAGRFSVNGQRARANNFMIDGVENNDISVAGPAFEITNNDAVQEVSVQTSQFSAEFGRAGGAVVNQITKSGTNSLHGTAAWVFRSQVFNATSNNQRRGATPGQKIPPVFTDNIPAFTLGGPVYLGRLYNGKNKTFFFVAGQWDRFRSTATSNPVIVPTSTGVATLQTLAPACPNAALYLRAIGNLRGVNSPAGVSIAVPSAAGTCNNSARTGQSVEVGQVSRIASRAVQDNNHQIRIDHLPSQKQTMSFRWLYNKNTDAPSFNNLDGFDDGFEGRTLTGAFTDTYVIKSNWTNEFRFNYGRIGFNFPPLAPDDFHANLPNFSIPGVTGFGIATNIPQFRFANNWQYQDTMSVIKGRHTVRFGVDFLRQLARQHPPFNERGSLTFQATTGTATNLANFIDDFGGLNGSLSLQFGDSIYHPNLFRQAYFAQDTWKVSTSLTLNAGLRYENYGQPVNIFRIPAFTNYDPVNFNQPNNVNPANRNFAPVFGFAWNPHFTSGLLGRFFGDGKAVWRGGFQISYDAFFNNLLSNIAGSSPNTLGGQITSAAGGRGTPNFRAQFASITARPPTALDPQTDVFDPNIRNPYTERWSFGFQRELPWNLLMDLSYVGSAGHKLFQSLDMNPFVAPGVRFVSTVGPRTMRASSANFAYNSLQLDVHRRYSSTPIGSLQFGAAYTYSHAIDNVSSEFSTDSTATAFQSAPQVLGFSPKTDRGNSDNDRRHRLAVHHVWDIRGPNTGVLGQIAGGWQLSGIWQFVTGAPFTVRNGTDRGFVGGGFGQTAAARPDIGNPNAPLNTRAGPVSSAVCPSLLRNIDTQACVTPNDVHWIQGTGPITSATVGRNTLSTPGTIQFDLNVIKTFKITEQFNLEYRAEIFNLFNRQNFGTGSPSVPPLSVGTSVTGFLDPHQTQALGRSMRMGLKLKF